MADTVRFCDVTFRINATWLAKLVIDWREAHSCGAHALDICSTALCEEFEIVQAPPNGGRRKDNSNVFYRPSLADMLVSFSQPDGAWGSEQEKHWRGILAERLRRDSARQRRCNRFVQWSICG